MSAAASRVTGNAALGGYFDDAFYLELLRTAHLHAVLSGVSLTGAKAMGLGGKIRARDKTLVPEESAELDVKANEFLAQFGLTREATISLLTNQLGVSQEELAYAWDIPTYTVMRGGQRQPEQAPEFFSANPLEPGHYTAGAYRPNNTLTHRQGSNLAPKAEEIYGRGGDPRHAGVQMREQDDLYQLMGSENLADLYPQGYGVNYEDDLLIPNTPLGWALEGAVGAMFGPTGRALMRAGGGRLFNMLAKNMDFLPPELLRKFESIAKTFDPTLPSHRIITPDPNPPSVNQFFGDEDPLVAEVNRITEELEWYRAGDFSEVPEEAADAFTAKEVAFNIGQLEGELEAAKTAVRNQRVAEVAGSPPGTDELASVHPIRPDGASVTSPTVEVEEEGRRLYHLIPDEDRETIDTLYAEMDERIRAITMEGSSDPSSMLQEIVSLYTEYEELVSRFYTPEYASWMAQEGRWTDPRSLPWADGNLDDAIDQMATVTPLRAGPLVPDESVTYLDELDRQADQVKTGISEYDDPAYVEDALRHRIEERAGVYDYWDPPPLHPDEIPARWWPNAVKTEPSAGQFGMRFGEKTKGTNWVFPDGLNRNQSVLDNWDPLKEMDLGREPHGHTQVVFKIGDIRMTFTAEGPDQVHLTWEHPSLPPDNAGLGRSVTGIRDGLRELGRVSDYLVQNGVTVRAQVDSSRASLVDAYRRAGFNIFATRSNNFGVTSRTGDIVPLRRRADPKLTLDSHMRDITKEGTRESAYSDAGYSGYFDISRDPLDEFLLAAERGQEQIGYGLPFAGETEWAGNPWALGTLNHYSSDDIAYHYLVRELGDYKPTSVTSEFEPSGRPNPYALSDNRNEIFDAPEDVVREAYRKMREDRAKTGYGHGLPNGDNIPQGEGRVVPASGREADWEAFMAQVEATIPEIESAAAFNGSPQMRPIHTMGGMEGMPEYRVSNTIRFKSPDGASRDIVIIELPDGTMQPFYRRSGQGNAAGDEALINRGGGGGQGQWVPFDGFGQYGMGRDWFRKQRFTAGMNADDPLFRFGTPELKAAGEAMDQYSIFNTGVVRYDGGPVFDLDNIRGIEMSTIPDDMLPEGYGQLGNGMGPGTWLEDENHFEPLFPDDLSEEVLDFLGVTHISGKPRVSDWAKGELADYDGMQVFNYQGVTPNDMRAGDAGFIPSAEMNELLGVHNMDDYSASQAMEGWEPREGIDFDLYGIVAEEDAPHSFSPMKSDGRLLDRINRSGGIGLGTSYGVGALAFLKPALSQEPTLEEHLAGAAPAAQPVENMLAWQARNNEGWWSWIKDYPKHLEWAAKATATTMDALEQTSRSTNDQVLDGLNDGFREQAHGLATQLGAGTVPLVGREDPELLKGVSRDLSQNGHNGHQIFSNDQRKEIENGDAMIVGYASDEDYQRAVSAAGRYGVVIDGNYWRKPSDNSLKPREGEEWTREHLQKMATSGYFGGGR